ncbi:RDD family protein [Streptosporangium sp. NPDC087985]|uniref:RDD family protein n=1 Tax=Streptosporangium sp. NPDC087985 TaxID=3366196 RepID=UPI00381CAECC
MPSPSSRGTGARTLAWRRITAWLIDWLWILILPVLLVPIGVTLYATGFRLPTWGWNLVSFLILVMPVTLWAAWRESGRFQATPGKRVRGLMVVDARSGQPVGFGRALLRNTVKIAIPWELGHTVAFHFATGAGEQPPGYLVVLTVLTYALMFGWAGSLFLPSGRTPYDRLSGARVIRRDA